MESEFVKDAVPAGVYVSAQRAAELLKLDEARVETLGLQGRLQVLVESGEERRYGYESALHMRAEDLMRDLTAKAREKCPELEEQIEALAGSSSAGARCPGSASWRRRWRRPSRTLGGKPGPCRILSNDNAPSVGFTSGGPGGRPAGGLSGRLDGPVCGMLHPTFREQPECELRRIPTGRHALTLLLGFGL